MCTTDGCCNGQKGKERGAMDFVSVKTIHEMNRMGK
jgi:hypothetical protein